MSAGIRREPALVLALILIALVVSCRLAAGIFFTPLTYDEAYNLQVAQHLASSGTYASDGALYGQSARPFDVFISTGPTVLLPVAGVMYFFGERLEVLRLLPGAAFVALLIVVFRATTELRGGRWGGLLAVIAILAIPSRLWPYLLAPVSPATVVGEYTCAAFALLAALHVRKHPSRAGLWLGLAVLTKFLALLLIPGFVLALLLLNASRLAVTCRLIGGMLLPLGAWQAYRLAVSGWDLYWGRTREFWAFLKSGGSGLGASSFDTEKFTTAGQAFALWASVLAVSLLAVLFGKRFADPIDRRATRGSTLHYWAGGASVWSWWLLFSDTAYARHLLIGTALLTPPAAAAIGRRASSYARSGILPFLIPAAAASVAAISVGAASVISVRQFGPSLRDQRAMAEYVRELKPDVLRFYPDAWPAPQLSYLTGIRAARLSHSGGLLVSDPYDRPALPPGSPTPESLCAKILRVEDHYLLCRVSPGTFPQEAPSSQSP